MFIMGGAEGSTAREAIKHKTIEKVVMCDLDKYECLNRCRRLSISARKKLNIVINDAKAELEKRNDQFDTIVGDLADTVEGGPCYQLYTKSSYEKIVKPKLSTPNPSLLNLTSNSQFLIILFWVVPKQASNHPLSVDPDEIDKRIALQIGLEESCST
ncbi:hypothetical protein SAY86_009255 [Trapa natans]|uniref:PABS domain-containing protein n=1 Tax=Trapa natans TaxID=22666 RepID=A0AAN7QSV5_TRANT|nr:hypothetical protein SAY86_009255 [Trapa natans]